MCHCVHLRFTFQICKDIQPLLCVQPKKRNVKCEYVSHSHFSNRYLQLFIDANQFLLFDSAAASLHMTRQCQVFRLSYKRKHFEFS